MGNLETLVNIVKELAEMVGIEFAGALLRPHGSLMKREGEVTEEGKEILEAARKAGRELIKEGRMSADLLLAVSRPLILFEDLIKKYNNIYGAVKAKRKE